MSNPLTHQREARHQSPSGDDDQVIALRIVLAGRVQGLGVRPAIARLAQELKLVGSVGNSSRGVSIHVEGPLAAVTTFRWLLTTGLPPGACVESQLDESIEPVGAAIFSIESSTSEEGLTARVPPDLAVCPKCLAEVQHAENRRHEYLFTTCTECGPRYSLLDTMSYDRRATGMNRFEPCSECDREYTTTSDRRFHSQTNSCPACGPRLWFQHDTGQSVAQGVEAIRAAVSELHRGRIVAIRGIGGYQLLVDATSPAAVQELRRRKQRFGKPLAIMVTDLEAAEQIAILDDADRQSVGCPVNPIVILRMKSPSTLASEVAAGIGTIGLMLPTSPLHAAIARQFEKPLVVTSGNLEGNPLAFEAEDASRELEPVADAWLEHDRPILRPIDDSVVRVVTGKRVSVRLARGLAPLPLELASRPLLALGGHQKAAIALSNGFQAVLGPHIGDLDTEPTRDRYLDHIKSMCRLYDMTPRALVCDQHPDYFTTRWATEQSIPAIAVQHHHAHVAAGMLEHGWLDREVLGVAWDGTGYGPDGTIWGGEFLTATATEFRRAGCIRPFALPGGETAVREPWRVAVSLVYQALGAERAASLRFRGITASQVERVVQLLSRSHACPVTSSAGRLFDAVAALALNICELRFEGQAAMLLEAACNPACEGAYPLPVSPGHLLRLDWRPLVQRVLANRRADVLPEVIAMRFHRALAHGVAAMVRQFPEMPVVLCGGCFQNRVLTELVVERFAGDRPIGTPGIIPCGDGGLAAGQLAVAAARLNGGWQLCV